MRFRALMEEVHKEEIGNRIRHLREESEHTNRSIGDKVGVDTRTVAGWVAGDGISYKNAKKVATLFGVSIGWLWHGENNKATPDLFAEMPYKIADVERSIRMEAKLDAILKHFDIEYLDPDAALPEAATAASKALKKASEAAKRPAAQPERSRKRQPRS